MGDKSAIEWTTATWNPWRGCAKVSPGCAHCYMFTEQRRYGRDPSVVVRCSDSTFFAPVRSKKWRELPEGSHVFTCSWSDWFHEDADPWRDEAWEIIYQRPDLVWQILTKRPERIPGRLPIWWGDADYEAPENVWLGVSIENRRFVHRANELDLTDIDWLIAGGESGPRCRPMRLEWVRDLRDACLEAGAAFFLKQLGGNPDKRGGAKAILDDRRWIDMPSRMEITR